MKRITIYLSILAAGLSLSSCDGFLDQPAQGQMTEGDFLGNSNSAASLTNSIYADLPRRKHLRDDRFVDRRPVLDKALRGSSMSDGGGTIYNNGTNQFQNLSGLTGSSASTGWLNAYTGIGYKHRAENHRHVRRARPTTERDPAGRSLLIAHGSTSSC